MKNTRLRQLVEQVARDHGTPEALSRDIVDLALSLLNPSARNAPREQDVARAVDEAWREFSSRLWAALEALSPEPALRASSGD